MSLGLSGIHIIKKIINIIQQAKEQFRNSFLLVDSFYDKICYSKSLSDFDQSHSKVNPVTQIATMFGSHSPQKESLVAHKKNWCVRRQHPYIVCDLVFQSISIYGMVLKKEMVWCLKQHLDTLEFEIHTRHLGMEQSEKIFSDCLREVTHLFT